MNFQKVVPIVKPFLEIFCQQTFSVLIAGTLLCSMHACYCSLHTEFFFGIMFSLKNKCSFCVLGGVFLRKKRWLLGQSPRPLWGAYSAPPYPWLGGRGTPLPHPPQGTPPFNFGCCTFHSLPTPLIQPVPDLGGGKRGGCPGPTAF